MTITENRKQVRQEFGTHAKTLFDRRKQPLDIDLLVMKIRVRGFCDDDFLAAGKEENGTALPCVQYKGILIEALLVH